jgi:hypothetical protein
MHAIDQVEYIRNEKKRIMYPGTVKLALVQSLRLHFDGATDVSHIHTYSSLASAEAQISLSN